MEPTIIESSMDDAIMRANLCLNTTKGDLLQFVNQVASGNTEADELAGLARLILERIQYMRPYRAIRAILDGDNPYPVGTTTNYRELVDGGWASADAPHNQRVATALDPEFDSILYRRYGDQLQFIWVKPGACPYQALLMRLPIAFKPEGVWPWVDTEWNMFTDERDNPAELVVALSNYYGHTSVFDQPDVLDITITE